MLEQAILDDIIRRIVEVAQPEKIILFGSAARGDMNRHSDVDLLIIKECENYRGSVSGFLAEIDRMQLEIREYLSMHPAELERG